jgi:hypothetical protein
VWAKPQPQHSGQHLPAMRHPECALLQLQLRTSRNKPHLFRHEPDLSSQCWRSASHLFMRGLWRLEPALLRGSAGLHPPAHLRRI